MQMFSSKDLMDVENKKKGDDLGGLASLFGGGDFDSLLKMLE